MLDSVLVAIRESEQNNNKTMAELQISTNRVKRYLEVVSKIKVARGKMWGKKKENCLVKAEN